MITKEELDQVLHFVSKRWIDMSRDPNHKAFQNMPTDFWMNSIGGGAGVDGPPFAGGIPITRRARVCESPARMDGRHGGGFVSAARRQSTPVR